MSDKFAPKCPETGSAPYVKTSLCWGRKTMTVVYAVDLKNAKATHGWTRARDTSINLRRATIADMEGSLYGWCDGRNHGEHS